MSKKVSKISAVHPDTSDWSVLVDEIKTEYWDSNDLTVEEKRFLDDMELIPEKQWEPISCLGKNLSETVIKERGAR